MTSTSQMLTAVALAERDRNGDTIVAWSYPSTDAAFDAHVRKRCAVEMEKDAASLAEALGSEEVGAVGSLCWTRCQGLWVYMLPFAVGGCNTALRQVSAFTVALSSKEFDPEKHGAICAELAKAYAQGGTPLKVLEGYLSIMTLGSFGSFAETQFVSGDAKQAAAPVGWLVEAFGVEVVLLWTAMLLKKRVVVYSTKVTELQGLLRVLPALVAHRDSWNLLRPYCIDEDDLSELQGVYCAGVTQPLDSRQDMWDLYIDLPATTVTVAEDARKDFAMTSVHKDVAGALLAAHADGAGANSDILDAVAAKTRDVVAKLEMLAEAEAGGSLTTAALQAQLTNTHLATFLFNVALTERLADSRETREQAEEGGEGGGEEAGDESEVAVASLEETMECPAAVDERTGTEED